MEFARFCTCDPAGYARLKQRVDACARLGRSYEFAGCHLPSGCRPAQAQLGFWRYGEDYLLYFRPAVVYDGTDPRLDHFFSQGAVQRYAGFQAMTDRLHTLAGTHIPHTTHGLFDRLRCTLQDSVLGQEGAVEAAAFKLWSHTCKREPLRPLSLIFYGPTGVGKSELGKAIAPALNRCLEEERYRLVWTELNTFTEAHSVYRLTGAPPGYVGYEDTTVLEAVRTCPYTVFMFDELDKAHPEVLKVFMSILDEGRCTARQEKGQESRELDFRRCIFLFTTNTDLSNTRRRGLGFSPPQEAPTAPTPQGAPSAPAGLAQRLFQADESARLALARSGVLREIAGRFSGLIGFHRLDRTAREAVTRKQIAALGREYGLDIVQVDPQLVRALTPEEAISPRSTVPMLEGLLTPLFLEHAASSNGETALCLSGTPDSPVLGPCWG